MNKGTAGVDGDRAQELVKQVFRPHPSLSLASHLIRPSISPPVVQIRGHEVAQAELNNLHPSRVSGTSSVLLVIFLLAVGEEVTLSFFQAVYQRNGNIFFRNDVKGAIASEQSKYFLLCLNIVIPLKSLCLAEQLDLSKAQLQKLSRELEP